MKRIICLVLITIFSLSVCACGAQDNQKDLTISDITNMTVDELKQFYNAEEYVGTPVVERTSVISGGKDAETFRVTRRIYDEEQSKTIFTKEYIVENTIKMHECMWYYPCIFVDNNTPDDYEDDQFVFVFNKVGY